MRAKLIIDQLINIHGYVSIDQFMKIALQEYYANENSIGGSGDFITAPEISQMFGEIIGVWCASKYEARQYTSFSLLEMGPGRGTMMKDILRATKNAPGFHANLESIILLETSPKLRDIQKAALSEYKDKLIWIDSIEQLEAKENLIAVANEFFDALPIKQFQLSKGAWQELGITRAIGETDLHIAQVRQSMLNLADAAENSIIEISPASELIARNLASSAANLDVLIIDYGYLQPTGKSTLQAVKNHKYHNPLSDIGSADITAHVDFNMLSNWFKDEGCTSASCAQGEFLKKYGIELRAQKLIESRADAADIHSALSRLTDPSQMGSLFKVLEIAK